jgi:hypothetical protein
LFRTAGLAVPTSAIECESLDAARALLLESDRVMLMSRHQVFYDLRAGLLAELPHPLGRVTRPVGLIFRSGWKPSRTQQRLLELLRAQAKQLALRPGFAPSASLRLLPTVVARASKSLLLHPCFQTLGVPQYARELREDSASEEPLALAQVP